MGDCCGVAKPGHEADKACCSCCLRMVLVIRSMALWDMPAGNSTRPPPGNLTMVGAPVPDMEGEGIRTASTAGLPLGVSAAADLEESEGSCWDVLEQDEIERAVKIGSTTIVFLIDAGRRNGYAPPPSGGLWILESGWSRGCIGRRLRHQISREKNRRPVWLRSPC